MKRIRAFTLLEIIIVIALISIITTSLINTKRNIDGNIDIGREAVNIMYKEMDQYLKDFQRNKIREDNDGNTHEIEYFRIYFGHDPEILTGNELTVGNSYNHDEYFNSGTLISGQKYSAFQYLKGAENYTFYTRNKSGDSIQSIRITNGKIYTNQALTGSSNSEYQFVICGGKGGKIEHIGAITINAISKESRLDRCKSDKYAGIDCSIFKEC